MRRLEFDDVVIDGHGNLIGRIGPAAAKTLVMDGHIDTVPVYTLDAWQHDPFGADIVDGYPFGRGSVDMKAAIAAFIYGGDELRRRGGEFAGCVLLVVSIAEEMREGATLAESFAGRLAVREVSDPTPSGAGVGTAGSASGDVAVNNTAVSSGLRTGQYPGHSTSERQPRGADGHSPTLRTPRVPPSPATAHSPAWVARRLLGLCSRNSAGAPVRASTRRNHQTSRKSIGHATGTEAPQGIMTRSRRPVSRPLTCSDTKRAWQDSNLRPTA